MDKTGLLWTIGRTLWALRNLITIVTLLTTVLYLMFSETLEQRRYMLDKFSEAQNRIAAAEGVLKTAGDFAFKNPSKSGASIPTEVTEALESAVRNLRMTLLSAPAPTNSIQRTRTIYASELADVLGAINLYEPGGDGEHTNNVLRALVALEKPATAYKKAATRFQTSVWASLWAAL